MTSEIDRQHQAPPTRANPGSAFGQALARRVAELEQRYRLDYSSALAYALAEAEAAATEADTPAR